MDIHRIYRFLFGHFRTRRMHRFATHFEVSNETTILDVGGYPYNWTLLDVQPQLTFLNLTEMAHPRWVVGDGCRLPFRDSSFDIVFSNSVIEHLGTRDAQQRFADEIRRVGRRFFLQTPNRWFVIEPHYLTPFVELIPRRFRAKWVRYGTVWGWLTQPSPAECRLRVEEIRLLTPKELQALFDSPVHRERLLGLTKALIVEG